MLIADLRAIASGLSAKSIGTGGGCGMLVWAG